ncbi:MAG: ATP-binding protein, partial [Polyangia bacterium]
VYAADTGPAVEQLGDIQKIRQILINLLGNAIKFTDKGSVRCGVAVRREADGALRLAVDVENTGPGVSASRPRLRCGQHAHRQKCRHCAPGPGLDVVSQNSHPELEPLDLDALPLRELLGAQAAVSKAPN